MLILVLILCLATSLYVALRRKDSLSLYLLGMSVCNLVMFAGIIVYIAQPNSGSSCFWFQSCRCGSMRFQSLWTGWAMWWQ